MTAQVSNGMKERYQWWPVRLGWRRNAAMRWFDWHGVQVASEYTLGLPAHIWPWRDVYAQVFHIGPLKVLFGRFLT